MVRGMVFVFPPKPDKAIKFLLKEGWTLLRVSGSHHIYVKEGVSPVTVPYHRGQDLSPHVLSSLEKATGIPFTKKHSSQRKK